MALLSFAILILVTHYFICIINYEKTKSLCGLRCFVNTYTKVKKEGDNNMQCPRCGNMNLQVSTETVSKGKDFSFGKGCCGAIILGPIGVLCGACGKGKQVKSTTYWLCPNCGNKFKA